MIMSPWNDPVTFSRAWCIYEVYCTAATNAKYEIALNKKEKERLLYQLQREGF